MKARYEKEQKKSSNGSPGGEAQYIVPKVEINVNQKTALLKSIMISPKRKNLNKVEHTYKQQAYTFKKSVLRNLVNFDQTRKSPRALIPTANMLDR